MTSRLGHIIYSGSHTLSTAVLNTVSCLSGIRYEVYGKENLPDGKAIIVSNHALPFNLGFLKMDSIDHILLGTKARRDKIVHFIAMDKFFSENANFFIRKYNELTEQIPFSVEKEAYIKMKDTVKKFLSEGEYIGIFPSPAHLNGGKFKLAAKLALENDAPIVPAPIKIISCDGKMPRYLVSENTKAVKIIFKPQINTSEFKEQYKNVNSRALEEMLSQEIWNQVYKN